MSNWCLECWNNDREPDEPELLENDVVLSEYLDLCEGCGKMKNVILEVVNNENK